MNRYRRPDVLVAMTNGKTDVIKAMGNTKWSDIELKR